MYTVNDCSEGEYLSSLLEGEEFDRECREAEWDERLARTQSRYDDNKRSDIGTTIRCATCGRRIKKKSYQTQFCSNRGRGNCKDTFWNMRNGRGLRTQRRRR